jgi:hypothetical protein
MCGWIRLWQIQQNNQILGNYYTVQWLLLIHAATTLVGKKPSHWKNNAIMNNAAELIHTAIAFFYRPKKVETEYRNCTNPKINARNYCHWAIACSLDVTALTPIRNQHPAQMSSSYSWCRWPQAWPQTSGSLPHVSQRSLSCPCSTTLEARHTRCEVKYATQSVADKWEDGFGDPLQHTYKGTLNAALWVLMQHGQWISYVLQPFL